MGAVRRNRVVGLIGVQREQHARRVCPQHRVAVQRRARPRAGIELDEQRILQRDVQRQDLQHEARVVDHVSDGGWRQGAQRPLRAVLAMLEPVGNEAPKVADRLRRAGQAAELQRLAALGGLRHVGVGGGSRPAGDRFGAHDPVGGDVHRFLGRLEICRRGRIHASPYPAGTRLAARFCGLE